MKIHHYVLTAAVALTLGGCAGGGNTNDIAMMRTTTVQGGTPFTQALASEYRKRTIEEADDEREDYDASWFAGKGLRAAKGEVVLPSQAAAGGPSISRWGVLGPVIYVRGDREPELSSARSQLIAFFDHGGRDTMPAIAARAQGAFDCWLEEEWEADTTSACRREFYQAMSEIKTAPVMASAPMAAARVPNTYQVFFDFDKSNISDTAAAIIRQAAANAKQGKLTRIDLTGHTDLSGPAAYNQALSERRAAAVKKELIKDGVPAGEITSVGVGKAGQLVPTADGVREPQNRRTEIMMHN